MFFCYDFKGYCYQTVSIYEHLNQNQYFPLKYCTVHGFMHFVARGYFLHLPHIVYSKSVIQTLHIIHFSTKSIMLLPVVKIQNISFLYHLYDTYYINHVGFSSLFEYLGFGLVCQTGKLNFLSQFSTILENKRIRYIKVNILITKKIVT